MMNNGNVLLYLPLLLLSLSLDLQSEICKKFQMAEQKIQLISVLAELMQELKNVAHLIIKSFWLISTNCWINLLARISLQNM